MINEKITSRQTIVIIILFTLGSSFALGISNESKQDSWISLIIAFFASIPIILIYARILKLYPGLGLYDIALKLFGKIGSKIIIIIMAWYALHLGTLVIKSFSEYINVTSLLNTPEIVVIIMLLLITVYIARSGPYIFGSWSLIGLVTVLMMMIISIFFSINRINIENIFPIMGNGWKKIGSGVIYIISFPFLETVLILPLAGFIKKKDSSYRIYIYGLLFSTIGLLVITLRNLTILGTAMIERSLIPSFNMARVIKMGNFLTKIEGVITINIIIAGITKITVCLMAFTLGIAKICAIDNYKKLIIPSSLLMLAFSTIIYSNTAEMLSFIKIYPYYAITFQLIIPIIIWITAEVKKNAKET
ncbi:MAG: endospore germination permease [Bacilli bacterium]|nr:endospore germination permease [Bacilli bacterium]MDD4808952.1 endospore germination permease [Bacilli bacterium]